MGKNYKQSLILMVFRTCYPQIQQVGILNTISWKTLREQQKQKDHFDFLPCPSSPKTGHKILLWKVSPYTPRKQASFSPKRKVHWECKQTSLAKFLPVYCASLRLLNLSYPTQLSTLHSTYCKNTLSLGLHYLMKAPLYIKLILNKFVCFSPFNLFLSVLFLDPTGDIKKVEENFFLFYTVQSTYISLLTKYPTKYVLNIHNVLGVTLHTGATKFLYSWT